jgi:hypothetical protein
MTQEVLAPSEMPLLSCKGERVAGDPIEMLVLRTEAADAFDIGHYLRAGGLGALSTTR